MLLPLRRGCCHFTSYLGFGRVHFGIRFLQTRHIMQWSEAKVSLKPTGQGMPLVGLGVWKVSRETCAQTVFDAIKAGYRLIDGACDVCCDERSLV